jgi:hypothetical protein
MTITNITKKVYVVTGKYDSVVVTPFGRWTVENHAEGVAEAQAYVARHA